MRILVSNKIKIENYSQQVLDYCKETLVLPNPEYYKREAQGRWTGNTQKVFGKKKGGGEMNKPSSYDMTFCISECNNKKCERNFKYLVKPYYIPFYSMAKLKGTKYCEVRNEKRKSERD